MNTAIHRLGPTQRAVLGALAEGPATVDELVRRCGLGYGPIYSALIKLRGRGLVACPSMRRGRPCRNGQTPARWARTREPVPAAAAAPAPRRDPHIPTEEEFEAELRAIRESWDARTELVRRGVEVLDVEEHGEVTHLPARNPIALPSCVARRNGRLMARRCGA